MQVNVEELAMMLGQRDIEIYALQKQVAELNKRVEELMPKPEPVTPA